MICMYILLACLLIRDLSALMIHCTEVCVCVCVHSLFQLKRKDQISYLNIFMYAVIKLFKSAYQNS